MCFTFQRVAMYVCTYVWLFKSHEKHSQKHNHEKVKSKENFQHTHSYNRQSQCTTQCMEECKPFSGYPVFFLKNMYYGGGYNWLSYVALHM